MKKIIFIFIFCAITFISKAQNDTTIVNTPTKFYFEEYVSKSGEAKTYYYCENNNETYSSNKSSYERYKAYKRFNKEYVAILITNKKSKRIVIL